MRSAAGFTPRLRIALALLLAGIPHGLQAQSWETLTAAPVTTRHNDIFFVSADTGWAVSGAAEIHRTTDGGRTWSLQFFRQESHFRSVGFLNAHRGFAGNVGRGEFGTSDPTALYETADGGATWTPVASYHGRTPTGLCGMNVVNDSTIVAVGRVRGPSFFVRTTDGGRTWSSKDMSEYASGLIDVYFSDPDTGFAVGLTDTEHSLSSGVILATTDGGETWERRFVSGRTGEWAWKISFPTRRTGYVSLQRNNGSPVFFLKTTDGGRSWEEKLFSSSHYFVQGIGFIDERTGWIGGNSTQPAYATTDGGDTWHPAAIGQRLNRFRFLGDSLGYAAGSTIHKFTGPVSSSIAAADLPGLSIQAAYPNPFHGRTSIVFTLDAPQFVSVVIHDLLGRTVRTLADRVESAGTHEVAWDGRDDAGRSVAAGTYFVVGRIGGTVHTLPVVRLR